MRKLMQYTTENVLVHPSTNPQDPDLILAVTPESAGWDFISFQARRLGAAGNFHSPRVKMNWRSSSSAEGSP